MVSQGRQNSDTTGRIWLWCGGRRLSALAPVRLRASRCDETDSRGSSVVAHARHERRLVRKGEFEPPTLLRAPAPSSLGRPLATTAWPAARAAWRNPDAVVAHRSLPESRPDVDVRRVDELGQRCGIHFTTRPQLNVAPALACSLQQASGVLQ